jgi:hypothetical protein
MASEASEQMMALLHELSMLKGLNRKYEINPTDSGQKEDRCANKGMKRSLWKSGPWGTSRKTVSCEPR